jgi:hypothetical protein
MPESSAFTAPEATALARSLSETPGGYGLDPPVELGLFADTFPLR